jgi:hypothetical protein
VFAAFGTAAAEAHGIASTGKAYVTVKVCQCTPWQQVLPSSSGNTCAVQHMSLQAAAIKCCCVIHQCICSQWGLSCSLRSCSAAGSW